MMQCKDLKIEIGRDKKPLTSWAPSKSRDQWRMLLPSALQNWDHHNARFLPTASASYSVARNAAVEENYLNNVCSSQLAFIFLSKTSWKNYYWKRFNRWNYASEQ